MTSSGAVLQNQSSAAELKSVAIAGGQKSAQGLAPPRAAGRPSMASDGVGGPCQNSIIRVWGRGRSKGTLPLTASR